MRVKCLAQEHNTMSPVRARTRSARPGVERTNHEATAPPLKKAKDRRKSLKIGDLAFRNIMEDDYCSPFLCCLPVPTISVHVSLKQPIVAEPVSLA